MSFYVKFVKPTLDFLLALTLILWLLPLYILLYIAVRFNMGSPVLFKQERPGKDEKPFYILKFRSMSSKTDKNGDLLPDKDRITRFGAFLRKSSLDEIPQFFNILKGEMSFVGPRPLGMYELPYCTKEERRRHLVKPGITGLAQISGRNLLSVDDKLKKDLEYVEKISFWTDIKICLLTIPYVLKSRGVNPVNSTLLNVQRKDKVEEE